MRRFFSPNSRFLLGVKIVIVLIPLLFLAWLANQRYMFTPTITVTYKAGSRPGPVVPETGKLIRTPDSGWLLSDDQLSFTVRIPRLVEQVRIRADLVNLDQPTIRLHATGSDEYGDQTRLVRHAPLDALDWNQFTNGAVHVWQRPFREVVTSRTEGQSQAIQTPVRQYDSVDAFLAEPPSVDNFGVVEVDPMQFVSLPDYQAVTNPITFPHAFRGPHTIYVYAANENIRFAFDKVDLNRVAGADSLTVLVRKLSVDPNESTLLHREVLDDDGNQATDFQLGQPQHLEVTVPVSEPGVYRVDIRTTEDVIFRQLTSYQHALAFSEKVFFSDGPVQGGIPFSPIQLFTHGKEAEFLTKHAEGLQTITINDIDYEFALTGQPMMVDRLPNPSRIAISTGDLEVRVPGLIAISPAILLPAGPVDVLDLTPGEVDQIDYVIGRYFPNPTVGTVEVDEVFRLSRLFLSTKTLHFRLEIPGHLENATTVELKSISATLRRGSLSWSLVTDKLFGED